MTTKKLYEFLALSKALNYSKAAQMLYVSQSVLSRHIMEMEEELGMVLFLRTSHSVILTEAGRSLAAEAEGLIDRCSTALNLVRIQGLPITGHIRIACSPEICYGSHINVFISRFCERYPEIDVQFEILPNGMPQSILEQYDFVLGFCEYVNLSSGIYTHRLYAHSAYLVIPPRHKLMSKPMVFLHELAADTLVVPFADEMFGPYAKNWKLAEKCTHGRISCLKAPNLQTALFLVSIGKGIALIPGYARQAVVGDTFSVGVRDTECCFNEYLYYNSGLGNDTAKLFYQEFCTTFSE